MIQEPAQRLCVAGEAQHRCWYIQHRQQFPIRCLQYQTLGDCALCLIQEHSCL